MRKLTKRQQKLLISAVGALIILLLSNFGINPELRTSLVEQSPGSYRVLQVNDGDTITVDMNGTEERIRFIGIDTPETQDPRKPVQCFGRAASSFTKDLILNQSSGVVRLEADSLSSNRDRYDRLLRYVYLQDGRLAQEEVLKNGYGFAYTSFPFTKSDTFKQLERTARQNQTGLWNKCDPEHNEYGGFESNPAN